ncbi:OsmC family protein [Plantibacter sp. M259]|uniref:OsmC family protein n=1 Tax=Plantibacter sp. M259 TaxID=2583822 RepID=UPI001110B675|nr:OsmC family protein [Plantibacter sp. M259]
MTTHEYTSTVTWSGRTDAYETYSRRHEVRLGDSSIDLSAAAEFRGDSALPNPEQLLVAAASSCQLLSFLAVAAHAGVEIIDYRDAATGIMPDDARPIRLTEIVLRPAIVAQGTTTAVVERLLEKAHRQCYIANSLTAVVTLEPEITVR